MTEYILFLAKTLTVLFSVLIIIAVSAALGSRKKSEPKGKLTITHFNKRIKRHADSLLHFGVKKKKKKDKKEAKESPKPKLFVLDFVGDIQASAATHMREEINCILLGAKENDEVLIRIQSPGGTVTGYGLAAAQLERIKNKKVKLTCTVDQVAASGGYLMACVADRLIAAPFAIIGSIGVVLQLPNFHRFLQKNQIDFEQLTAGEYKRTLSLFAENTEEGRKKTQQDIELTHTNFKAFITKHRPSLSLDEVATGEYWHAHDALEKGLVDELATSDEVLLKYLDSHEVLLLRWTQKKGLAERIRDAKNSLSYAISQNSPY